MAAASDNRIDRLYAVPFDEFVARRDELARALRGEGRRDAADEVAALRKPTVAAWAVNQLARREKRRVRALLAAGERLRRAHGDLLRGGSARALQRAGEAEREATGALTRAAEGLLAEAGRSTGPATLERVRETLHAAAVDEGVAERLRAGRLVSEHEAAGFGLAGLGAAAAPAARRKRAGTERQDERRRAARERRRAAEEALREARRAAKEAERAVNDQTRALERAERELAGRRKAVERAERDLERAR